MHDNDSNNPSVEIYNTETIAKTPIDELTLDEITVHLFLRYDALIVSVINEGDLVPYRSATWGNMKLRARLISHISGIPEIEG